MWRAFSRFSLGMAQWLGIAAALLGDPGIVILDEPVNGPDPEGIRWMRNLLKSLAGEGRTVARIAANRGPWASAHGARG